jgi:tRNA-binding EMAP/Myf-like protein
MRVAAARQHPDADALRVYRFEAPGFEDGLQIVANMENVYEVGDMAYVALVGCVLKDGTKISKAVLRGIDSFGMALGHCEKMGAEPGSVFTSHFCREELPGGAVVKWPSIEGLHHIRKGMKVRQKNDPEFVPPVVTYYAKVKLHGTNAGVQILKDGTVKAQGRNRVLTLKDDNLGFASWVTAKQDYFKVLAGPQDMVIYGEWCGRGIQKGVAISGIDRKILAVFAIQFGLGRESRSRLLVDPSCIRRMLPEHPDILVLPWHDVTGKVLKWGDRQNLELRAAEINLEVAEVEKNDPWVSRTFGVDGTGEGLVLYPVSIFQVDDYVSQDLADTVGPLIDRDRFSELVFKAKGDKHKVVKQKRPAQVDPEAAKNVADFVDMFLTDARLEQGVAEACGGECDLKRTGDFLKWIGQDVKKESTAELEASGLEWKQVGKAVGSKARQWYIQKAKEL